MLIKVKEILQEKFNQSDWYKLFLIEDIFQREEIEQFYIEIIRNTSVLFSESLLIGEYVYNLKIEEEILDIENSISKLYNDLLGETENIELISSVENFVNTYKKMTTFYYNFCKIVSIYNSQHSVDMLFSSLNNTEENIENDFSKQTERILLNFLCTIYITKLDIFFDESYEYLKSLIELEHVIKNLKEPFIHISALNFKLSFLKYKWSIRQITTSNVLNLKITTKGYMVNNNLYSVLEKPELSNFKPRIGDWKDYLESHYEYVNPTNFQQRKFESLNLKPYNELDFIDLHFLIKFYKDLKKDYLNLSQIVSEIERRKDEFVKTNTTHIYYKNLIYALNNQFSLLIDTEKVKEDEILDLKNKIISIQNKTGNNNFFIEFKYLNYRINQLEKFVKNRNPLDTNNEIKNILEEIRTLFVSCERKILWSENHHNLLYQLPYEESIIEYNSETIDCIYYASSFLLPLSIEQIKKEYGDLKIKFNNNYNHYEVLSSLNKELDIIKDLKSNVENSDKKSIETITIYTAVISFIVGSVSLYNFIDSFYKSVIFILIFSTSLSAFSLLVLISTKGFKTILDNKKPIMFFYAIIAALIIITFCAKEHSDAEIEKAKKNDLNKIIDKKIDSIMLAREVNLKMKPNPKK